MLQAAQNEDKLFSEVDFSQIDGTLTLIDEKVNQI